MIVDIYKLQGQWSYISWWVWIYKSRLGKVHSTLLVSNLNYFEKFCKNQKNVFGLQGTIKL